MHSYASVENTVVLPYVDIGRPPGLRNVIIDRGVQIPDGLVVGEDPELDAQRFRRTDKGICLITQPMLDRLGSDGADRTFSAVVSEIFPLIKTGGLADVAGALPGALAARRRRRALAGARLSARTGRAGRRRGRRHASTICSAARRALLAAQAPGLDLFVLDAPHLYARDGDPYRRARMAGTGPTTRSASPRWRACGADIGHGLVAGYRPDVVHAHDWQAGSRRPICTMPARHARRP